MCIFNRKKKVHDEKNNEEFTEEELIGLDNYDVHLIKNGPIPDFHNTTFAQREEDYQSIRKALLDARKEKNSKTNE